VVYLCILDFCVPPVPGCFTGTTTTS